MDAVVSVASSDKLEITSEKFKGFWTADGSGSSIFCLKIQIMK